MDYSSSRDAAVRHPQGGFSALTKVAALDTVMRLPMKVSTTTSNFMIGEGIP